MIMLLKRFSIFYNGQFYESMVSIIIESVYDTKIKQIVFLKIKEGKLQNQ